MKPKRKTNDKAETDCSLSFEQAIQQLERIVADMEQAELPLEDILKKYEEGTGLVRFCTRKLDEAEKKIELLTQKADGSVNLKPFGAEAATEAEDMDDDDADAPDNIDEEGKLF